MAGFLRLFLASGFAFPKLTGSYQCLHYGRASIATKTIHRSRTGKSDSALPIPSRRFLSASSLYGMERHEELPSPDQTASAAQPQHWSVCPSCHGEGKLTRPPSRKARLRHKRTKTASSEDVDGSEPPPSLPMRIDPCNRCNRTGILPSDVATPPDPDRPTVAIVGGGLGGLALAAALRHRRVPHRVYERDATFDSRSQGYGLTMQQAAKALSALGVPSLAHGMTSTRHVVHDVGGTVVGEWGLRKWGRDRLRRPPRRQNVHVARQALRRELLDRVDPARVSWGCRLVRAAREEVEDGGGGTRSTVRLEFRKEDDTTIVERADIVVGADGIRSTVRKYLVEDGRTPLQYLGCLVVLGICPLDALEEGTRRGELLDGATVFQTADGSTRIYCMPFSKTQYMWQLSFPMDEAAAKETSRLGPDALKAQALNMCDGWHSPIGEILQKTPVGMVSGYPVYDRDLLTFDMMKNKQTANGSSSELLPIALIGDAAHPMSPFKGQGANQALLDALVLARSIYANCCRNKSSSGSSSSSPSSDKNQKAIDEYHQEMIARSARKVQASAQAAQFLHTDVAIHKGNVTRGAAAAAATTTASTQQSTE